MALHLATDGVDVIGTYRRNADEAASVAREVEARGARAVMLPLDVSVTASFGAFADALRAALRAEFGRDTFDVLINNAGEAEYGLVTNTTEAQFDRMMAVHIKGPFFLTQQLLPLVADGGQVINLSSGLTRFAFAGRAAYAAAKGAVEVYTRYLAQELGGRGIRAIVVAPGAIATDFGGGMVRDNPEVNRHVASIIALGRVGEADDVGAAVAALVGPGGRWINGERIEVSGGQHL
jgi:NAD(P)-dependent dehydrogenase (short-subunit alcohol dehydrogenase family)